MPQLLPIWEVYEHRRPDHHVQPPPVEVLKRYEKWKDIVRVSGPVGDGCTSR